jgi:2-polyprenyl-3-methyl-5-hydroxy-6-metoxy-1,4-benzoquinol methylase
MPQKGNMTRIVQRTLTRIQSALKSYGPSGIKRFLWNREYSGDKWNFADNTAGDCVYSHLEKYAANGSILDLGCGSGNTGNELAAHAYRKYVGVDISETCLTKAIKRSKENGRAEKNQFVSGDFLSYVPNQQFDVILFRESMYHVPMAKITSTIDHYSRYLKEGGVFIVRMGTSSRDGKTAPRPTAMIRLIEEECNVLEKCQYAESGATVIVFRPSSVQHAERSALGR